MNSRFRRYKYSLLLTNGDLLDILATEGGLLGITGTVKYLTRVGMSDHSQYKYM